MTKRARRGGKKLARVCGTETMYQASGCRCPACKEAHRKYRARRRAVAYSLERMAKPFTEWSSVFKAA